MGKMEHRFSIRLYVRRVFIKEFNDLIPKWMGFLKGIVDSDDMPLNIGREKLQQNAILKHIKVGLVKNSFQLFNELAEDKKRYKQFFDSFSQCLKLGVYEDHEHRSQIMPLLRYYSSRSGDDLVSLDEYIGRMKSGQQYILYITGRNRRDAARSPFIEGVKRDGYEVLYMTDPVDEYALQFMKEYKDVNFISCMNGNVHALLRASTTNEDMQKDLEPQRRIFERLLAGEVESVVSAAGPAERCSRLLPSSAGSTLPILELNFKHTLLKEISKRDGLEDDLSADLARALLSVAKVEDMTPEDVRRTEVTDELHQLISKISAGETEFCPDDLPNFLSASAQHKSLPASAAPTNGKAKDAPLLSCGGTVRVIRGDRARRATIAYADDDAADVMYLQHKNNGGSGEEEDEGVPAKHLHALLDFEATPPQVTDELFSTPGALYKTATKWKEEGNSLYKLKDFDAAIEWYTGIVAAFARRPLKTGDAVLVAGGDGLRAMMLRSVDRETGAAELMDGTETSRDASLAVYPELLPLQTAAHMNRARCLQAIGRQQAAAQDLTIVLALWSAADRRMLDADAEMKEACVKGLCTARYLRSRSRLARGLVKQAAADVREGLAGSPPPAMAKQLREVKAEVQKGLEELRRLNSPLAKEFAKVKIALGGPI